MLISKFQKKFGIEDHSAWVSRNLIPTSSVILNPCIAKYLMCFTIVYGVLASPAHAIQSHPAPEGLYVHQLAHVCFIISMGFLAYWLEVQKFCRKKGWRYIQIAALLFVFWNILAFAGHCVEEKIPRELFVGDPDWSQRLVAHENMWADLFYVLKLDHLASVPAIICLFVGIRLLYRDVEEKEHVP